MQDLTRVQAVRAGWEFPEYQFLLRERHERRKITEEQVETIEYCERSLRKVFRNPAFSLEMVMEKYISGQGSNQVLEVAFHGLPSFFIDWFRVGQVARVNVEKFARGDQDQSVFGLMTLDALLSRVGVDSRSREVITLLSIEASVAPYMGSNFLLALHQLDNKLQEIAAGQDRPVMRPNIWINGSFFLVALISIIVTVRAISGDIAPYWIAVILVGGIISILAIGILALRANDQMSDRSFTENLSLVLKSLPVLGRLSNKKEL